MPQILASGRFKIVSLTEGERPTSVNYTEPGLQIVRLGQPVDAVINDKVVASIDPKVNVQWIATYREYNDAYTISPVYDESKGWTVPAILSIHPEIEIKPIASTKSIPPQFFPPQLFRFVPPFDE